MQFGRKILSSPYRHKQRYEVKEVSLVDYFSDDSSMICRWFADVCELPEDISSIAIEEDVRQFQIRLKIADKFRVSGLKSDYQDLLSQKMFFSHVIIRHHSYREMVFLHRWFSLQMIFLHRWFYSLTFLSIAHFFFHRYQQLFIHRPLFFTVPGFSLLSASK